MRPVTIALDMDSTVYDLQTSWLKWLEEKHGERLRVQDILTWDWHNQLKCGVKIYDFLYEEGVFLSCPLMPAAKWAIDTVHALGVRQFFISTCKTKLGPWEKMEAVARDFPYLKGSVLITSHDKDLIAADVLVDDGPHNLEAFKAGGGVTIKVPYTYNKSTEADYTMTDWMEYPGLVADLMWLVRSST